jgi:hypothetical protein
MERLVMTRLNRLFRSRRAAGDALYYPNQFLIILDAKSPLWLDTDERHEKFNARAIPRFVHEYWHYWHNISTVAGLEAMVATQQIRRLFETTLRGDGTSAGQASLATVDAVALSTLVARRGAIEGQAAPRPVWEEDFRLTFSVRSHRVVPVELPDGTTTLEASIDVDVTLADGSSTSATMSLGTGAIEESVAYLVEEQFRVATRGIPDPPPWFPYQVASEVVRYFGGRPTAPAHVAALATLSLLYPEPGPSFLALGERFRDALTRAPTDERAVEMVLAQVRDAATLNINQSIALALPTLVDGLAPDAVMRPALASYQAVCADALGGRTRSLLADLAIAFPRATPRAWDALRTRYHSCDVLQERAGADLFGRDELTSAAAASTPDRYGAQDFPRLLQAQQHYVYAHVVHDAGELRDSDEAGTAAAPTPCPYFSACRLEYRQENPDVCGVAPWKVFIAHTGCWYNGAVAASLGAVLNEPGAPPPPPPRPERRKGS